MQAHSLTRDWGAGSTPTGASLTVRPLWFSSRSDSRSSRDWLRLSQPGQERSDEMASRPRTLSLPEQSATLVPRAAACAPAA